MLAARLGDKTFGNCSIHGPNIEGRIISCSNNVIIGGMPAARIGDSVLGNCGCISTIIEGSDKSIVSGMPMARLGDSFIGTYTGVIIEGASMTLMI
jgi:uncharacterized Zn-binding protein involved in type VI secretion